jgi:hypothetical protein
MEFLPAADPDCFPPERRVQQLRRHVEDALREHLGE